MSIETDLRALGFTVEGDLAIEAELDVFSTKIRDELRDIAPKWGDRDERRENPPHPEWGVFADTITVSRVGPGRRHVGSSSPIALWQEIGTRHFPEDAIFAKIAKLHGGTGPIIDEGVQAAQSHLRGELETLEKLAATGASSHALKAQRLAVEHARQARSSAFKAAKPRRGRRR